MIFTMKEAEDIVYKSYLRAITNISETHDSKVKRPDLTRKLLDLLGSPDKGKKFILVTGSKGKGSTSRFISSLLGHLGLKVGLFTSPHLVNFNERIRINGKSISDEDFIRISNKVVKPLDTIESELEPHVYQGPVGVALAIATLYFKENNTDINVIECGRGGRYDDTNILENDWAVITPIMEEHILNLGPTIDDIIIHKLGIIKPSTKYVCISEQYEDLQKFKKSINENTLENCSYYGEDFFSYNISLSQEGTRFDVKTKNNIFDNIKIPLLGSFQAVNVATAIKVCEDVVNDISYNTVKNCFGSIQWPGRCEIIDSNPTVIVDGAINEKSAEYVQQVLENIKGENIVSIVGVPVDKDYKGVLRVVSQFSKKVIITKPDISHLVFPTNAKEYALSFNSNIAETSLLHEAVELAKNEKNIDLILIIGTQTLIANAKRMWNQSLLDIGL